MILAPKWTNRVFNREAAISREPQASRSDARARRACAKHGKAAKRRFEPEGLTPIFASPSIAKGEFGIAKQCDDDHYDYTGFLALQAELLELKDQILP